MKKITYAILSCCILFVTQGCEKKITEKIETGTVIGSVTSCVDTTLAITITNTTPYPLFYVTYNPDYTQWSGLLECDVPALVECNMNPQAVQQPSANCTTNDVGQICYVSASGSSELLFNCNALCTNQTFFCAVDLSAPATGAYYSTVFTGST